MAEREECAEEEVDEAGEAEVEVEAFEDEPDAPERGLAFFRGPCLRHGSGSAVCAAQLTRHPHRNARAPSSVTVEALPEEVVP